MKPVRDGQSRGMADGYAPSSSDNGARHDVPVAELVRSLLSDVSLLLRKEVELATIEMKAKARKAAGGAALLGAGAVVALLALATLVACAVIALAIVLPAWAAALIVGSVLLTTAAVLAFAGRARMRAATPLAPRETIDAAREDIGWVRDKTEELKTSG
jgi:uncharacterized membrane protein YqjE